MTVAAVRVARVPSLGDFVDVALIALLLAAIFWPVLPTPFMIDGPTAWRYLCYAFALPVLLLALWRGRRFHATPFDYALAAYLLIVIATWPTSVDRHKTMDAMVALTAPIAVFYAIRILVSHRPAAARFILAGTLAGIALLEWIATSYHLWAGFTTRPMVFPPLEWNGRQGLSAIGVVQFGLLVGIWQTARSQVVRGCALILLVGSAAELIFFYARDPWIAAIAVLVVSLAYARRHGGIGHYVLGIAVVLALIGSVRTPYLTHLAKGALGLEEGAEGGLPIRLGAWRDALIITRRHPITGIGLGNYVDVRFYADLPRFTMIPAGQPDVVHPHNTFLQQLAELGIFGGVAYAALWAIALQLAWKISVDASTPAPIRNASRVSGAKTAPRTP